MLHCIMHYPKVHVSFLYNIVSASQLRPAQIMYRHMSLSSCM